MVVWPCNRRSVAVFMAMGTQWLWASAGMGGAHRVGLNYAALPELWRRLRVPPADRDAVFADLQLMEMTALETFREDAE